MPGKKLLFMLVAGMTQLASAAPYTGSGIPCGPSGTPATCKIDILDFMKTKYTVTTPDRVSRVFTADSTNLAAAANAADTSAFQYIKAAGRYYYDLQANAVIQFSDDVHVRHGFMNHPSLPNVLLHSKTGQNVAAGGTIEYFRWAGGADNSLYVLSEPVYEFPPKTGIYGFRSFSQTDKAPNMYWRNRGYFWSDKEFDVTRNPANPGEWLGAVRSWSGSHHDQIAQSSDPGQIGGKFGSRNVDTSQNSVQVKYYPNETGAWINDGGGMLPAGAMEILAVTLRKHDPATGAVTWWERYDYARQRQPDGSYSHFGMIRFRSSINYYAYPNAPKCRNGIPPAAVLKCGDFDFVVESESHYNALADAGEVRSTVRDWYQTALSAGVKARNDPKLTKRATAEDLALPNNRGGFTVPGSGADAKNAYVAPGDMLYLESTTVEQDWYAYPNGKDPLFAPAASPANYCREGYKYLASFPAARSYNGLTGEVEDTGALHWVIVCGTSTDAYFHGSNGGDASCVNGYVTRGWWANANRLTFSTCYPNGSCADEAAKQFINLCVSAPKETLMQYPAPNP